MALIRPADFEYHPGRSTSHIIFYGYNANLRVLSLSPIPFGPIGIGDVNPQHLTILSSCQGLIACRNHATNTYYVGNPLCIRQRDELPPCINILGNVSHVVLGFHSPHVLVSGAGVRAGYYIIYAYNYHDDFRWHSFPTNLTCRMYGAIVPHSGVAFRRAAFWILRGSKRKPSSLLRFIGDVHCRLPTVSILDLPFFHGRVRKQLGRAMGRLGLVAVNETNSTVELFTLLSGWRRQLVFNVEISRPQQLVVDADGQEAETNVASWRQEDRTMVCRAMPRPIRFDSFKVELLFWVQGRVLHLENCDTNSHQYRLTVIPGLDVPASITNGIPLVFNGLH